MHDVAQPGSACLPAYLRGIIGAAAVVMVVAGVVGVGVRPLVAGTVVLPVLAGLGAGKLLVLRVRRAEDSRAEPAPPPSIHPSPSPVSQPPLPPC